MPWQSVIARCRAYGYIRPLHMLDINVYSVLSLHVPLLHCAKGGASAGIGVKSRLYCAVHPAILDTVRACAGWHPETGPLREGQEGWQGQPCE